MGIEKLPENSQAKLYNIISDGRVTGEEIKGLTEAEAEALAEQLGGRLPGIGEVVELASSKGVEKVEKQEEKPGFWKRAKKFFTETTAGKVIAGTVLTGIGVIATAATFGTGVAVMAGVIGGTLTLGGCTPGDEVYNFEGNNTNINNSITINNITDPEIKELLNAILEHMTNNDSETLALLERIVTILENNDNSEVKDLLKQILGMLKEQVENGKTTDEKTLEALNKILDAINNGNGKLDEIIETLAKQNGDITLLIELLKDNNAKQDQIIEALDKGNEQTREYLDKIVALINSGVEISTENRSLLNRILGALNSLDTSQDNSEIVDMLNKIFASLEMNIENSSKNDEKTQALLESILSNIQNFNNDNKQLLIDIYNKLDSMSENDKEFYTNILEMFNNLDKNDKEFYTKVLEMLNNLDKNDKTTQDLLKSILSNIQNFNNDNKQLLIDIYNKLDSMSENDKEFYTNVLENFEKLQAQGKDSVTKILNAIAENTQVAQGTQDLVKIILENLDVLGSNTDKILEALGNITIGGNVDLSGIESMLKEILAATKENGNTLNNIDSKLAIIQVTVDRIKVVVEGMKDQLGDGYEAILKKLDEILNKIPEGCNCNCDVTVVIEKLETIIKELQKDDCNNEGIIKDLDDLLG